MAVGRRLGQGCAGPLAGRAAPGLLPVRRKPGGGGGLLCEAGTSLLRCRPRGAGPTGGCRRRRSSQLAVICIDRQTPEELGIAMLSSPLPPLGANARLHPARSTAESKSSIDLGCVRPRCCQHPCDPPPVLHQVTPLHPWKQRGDGVTSHGGQERCSVQPGSQTALRQPWEQAAAPVMSPWLLVSCTLSRKVTGPDNIIYIAV